MANGFVTIYKRDMRRFVKFKHQLLSSLLQPVLWLAFFGMAMAGNFDRILGGDVSFPGVLAVDYLTFMCAGIISATVLFTSIFGGFFVLFDKNWGLMREVMASPIRRRNIVSGLAFSGVTKAWIQAVIILVFGLVLGVDFFPGADPLTILLSLVGLLAFVGIFSAGFICISLTLALKIDSPEGFQGVATLLTMPLFFMSNSLYPMEGLPVILQQLAIINPLTHLTTGVRFCTVGSHFSAIGIEFQYSAGEILLSFGYLCLIAAIAFYTALRTIETTEVT